VEMSISSGADIASIVEEILLTLGEQNVIDYGDRNVTSLLTPAGRVLSLLIQKPSLTVREMSVLLGTTESSIIKAIAKLLDDGLIARTKVNGRNEYKIVGSSLEKHSDIRGLFLVIGRLLESHQKDASDSTTAE
jgi:Mn-dependent DtxR family transcriptional regulator